MQIERKMLSFVRVNVETGNNGMPIITWYAESIKACLPINSLAVGILLKEQRDAVVLNKRQLFQDALIRQAVGHRYLSVAVIANCKS